MKTSMKRILLVGYVMLLSIVCSHLIQAQSISITTIGTPYNQDFNTLTSTAGTGQVWTNDATLTAWYLFRQPSPGTALTTYGGDNGGNNTGQFYSYGSTTERSFGAVGSGGAYYGSPAVTTPAGWMAVAFTNNTGVTVNEITLNFNGEQWRDANASAQTMVLEYGYGASFTTVTWIAPGGTFDWSSPVHTGSNTAVDGNTAGLVTGVGGTLSSIGWTNGTTLWVRWVVMNATGTDHGMAIDDFTFNTVNTCTPPAFSETHQDVLCNSGSTGSIDLTTIGGTSPFTFLWSGPSSFSATTEDISGLAAGIYTVVTTASGGCTSSTTVTINESPVLSSVITSSNNVTCNGGNNGSIDLTPSGGTGTYTYLWSNLATTQDISGLISGNYSVTVTDGNGCTTTNSTFISQPNAILLSTTQVDATCGGTPDGSIDLTPSGGTGSYTYLWSNSAITQDISGLAGGNYTVTVTDGSGCTASTSVTIFQPSSISLSTLVNNVICYGGNTGSINLTPSGGTGGYTFLWSNGAVTEDISALVADTFSVVVTDGAGCNASTTAIVLQPTPFTAITVNTPPTCATSTNGSIDLIVSGGTAGFTYNWSNGATTQDLAGLSTGIYSVLVTDVNGCTTTASSILSSPTNLDLSVAWTNTSCNGGNNGAINLSVLSGSVPFVYNWSNGATTQDITGLTAGSYSVLVTDANGCNGNISAGIAEPGLISSNISVTTCGSYTSPSGLYVWTTTGLYSDTLTSSNGCDSLIGIALTIPTPNTSVVVSGFTLVASLPGATYQWLDCNNGMAPIAGATGQFYTSPVMGSFAVIVNQGGCFDTSSCYTTFNTAQIPANLDASVVLYPNPNNGNFNVSISGLVSSDLFMEVIDFTGKVVHQEFKMVSETSVVLPFELNNLQNGIYILRVFSGGKYKTWRFIKN